MDKLKWTTDLPTSPGWYFYRLIDHTRELVIEPIEFMEDDLPDRFGEFDFLGNPIEWYGPISLPE